MSEVLLVVDDVIGIARAPMVKFSTTLTQGEAKHVVGIVVPPQVVEALGGGKRAPVLVSLNGHAYRSTLAVMGGQHLIPLAADHRAKAKVEGGQTVEVEVTLDAAPREVAIPDDLAAGLAAVNARAAFDALAFSHRKEYVRAIEEAKTPETRARRIEKAVEKVVSGIR